MIGMAFLTDARITAEALDNYYQQSVSGDRPVINQPPMQQWIADMQLASHVRAGGLSGEKLAQFLAKYLSSNTRLHHPGFLGHQCAIPHYAGALGSMIDGFTNNAMAIYEMGPGAASIEYFVVNWLLERVGWQPAPLNLPADADADYGAGVLVHGGSLANLTALIAARTRIAPAVWQEGNPGDLVILAPAESHYSVARAAGILGLGHRSIYELAVDDRGVVIPDRLPAAYQRVHNDGKRAMALVANACSTAVGLYDPLDEIGDFCRERDLWLHVDGAHGASALLSDKHKGLLTGVEKADSLIWDAHKLMRTPTVCAAVLVRDFRTLDEAFQQEASYLLHDKEQPGFDFIQRTVECTKAGLGLRLFLVLAALGERGMAQYVERQYQLTREAYEYIEGQADFCCAVRPEANILCLRIEGSDELQLAVRDRLIAQGNFYLSSASFRGQRYLRAVFMSPSTTLADIKQLIQEIRRLAAE
jgi:L-2,4-diaminobutyrate decarboxylase